MSDGDDDPGDRNRDELEELFDEADRDREEGFDWLDDVDRDADGARRPGPEPDGPTPEDRSPEPDAEPGEGGDGAGDPFVPGGDEGGTGPAASGPDADSGDRPGVPDPEDPFGEPDPRGDPFESGDSVFRRQEVGEVDPDEVWERLSEMEAGGSVATEGDSVYAEVSKHSYCEQCEYFSEPPDVACTHETGEIIEFLDMETVRLLNCPVVAERRELERDG